MKEILINLFNKYNINFDEDKLCKLEKFYKLVLKQNEVMNLTNIIEENEFAIKNILDSVLPINTIPSNATLVDVGAGAGFPSIPLKILRPDIKITMIDSLNKRVKFLNDTIKDLKLNDICAVHIRAEDFSINNREKYDIVIARAVARLNTLCELCLPLVCEGGTFIAYKSMKADEEVSEAERAINILGGKVNNLQNVLVKEIDSIRVNVMIKKVKPSPKEYPRGKNLPKLKPII